MNRTIVALSVLIVAAASLESAFAADARKGERLPSAGARLAILSRPISSAAPPSRRRFQLLQTSLASTKPRSPIFCCTPHPRMPDINLHAPRQQTLLLTSIRRNNLYAAALLRRKSGGTASSAKALSAASTGRTGCPSLPRRRMETVRSVASFFPTTSMTGTFASECSRTL